MKKTTTIILTLTVITLTTVSILQFNYLRKIEYNLRSMNTRAERTTAIKLYDFDDSFLGEKNAPVEVILFTDFECPYCRQFSQEIIPEIKKEYVETGKAKLIFKHLPLPYHRQGIYSAYVAEYAKEKGKFWEMYDFLYQGEYLENQLKGLKPFALSIGLDTAQLMKVDQNYTYTKAIDADEKDATIAGINGTPALIINNRVYGVIETIMK
jgi:protein-disulfide isomerase